MDLPGLEVTARNCWGLRVAHERHMKSKKASLSTGQAADIVQEFDGARNRNRTSDTRIFNPQLNFTPAMQYVRSSSLDAKS